MDSFITQAEVTEVVLENENGWMDGWNLKPTAKSCSVCLDTFLSVKVLCSKAEVGSKMKRLTVRFIKTELDTNRRRAVEENNRGKFKRGQKVLKGTVS